MGINNNFNDVGNVVSQWGDSKPPKKGQLTRSFSGIKDLSNLWDLDAKVGDLAQNQLGQSFEPTDSSRDNDDFWEVGSQGSIDSQNSEFSAGECESELIQAIVEQRIDRIQNFFEDPRRVAKLSLEQRQEILQFAVGEHFFDAVRLMLQSPSFREPLILFLQKNDAENYQFLIEDLVADCRWCSVVCPHIDPESIASAMKNCNIQKALELISSSPKQPIPLEELREAYQKLRAVGEAKDPDSPNQSDLDLIARVVMRHPHREALDILYQLHQALSSKLKDHSDEGLSWLLGGAPASRGSFTDAAMLRAFLEKDPTEISSSRLMTGLDTLLTAIPYRALQASWANAPKAPETEEQKRMFDFCSGILPKILPPISISYPDRYLCEKRTFDPVKGIDQETELVGDLRGDLSDVSDEESLPSPKALTRKVCGKTKDPGTTKTWVFAAQQGRVPMYNGVSGTGALALVTADRLLENDTMKDLRKVELLTGALLIPSYLRGGYHQVAETAAGMQYYLAQRPGGDLKESIMVPQNALKKGLTLLQEGVDPQYKKHIEVASSSILGRTKYIEYTNDPHDKLFRYKSY